jgi:hypothetical protein
MKTGYLILFLFLSPLFAFAQEKPDSSATQFSSHLLRQTLPEKPIAYSLSGDNEGSLTIGGAFMRSLLIPGWGQRRAGAKTAARDFFVTEVLLWSGYAAMQVYGHWLKDDYKLFAATYAGAEVGGKDDQFFVDMGNFISVDEFNQSRLRRRDVEGLYDPTSDYWHWDTEAHRQSFRNLRIRSDRAFSRSMLVVAGVIGNHIVSGIHAAWLAHKKAPGKQKGELNAPQLGFAATPEEIRVVARVEF